MSQKEMEFAYMDEHVVHAGEKVEGLDVYIVGETYYYPIDYMFLPSLTGRDDSRDCAICVEADSLEALIQKVKEAFGTDITKTGEK